MRRCLTLLAVLLVLTCLVASYAAAQTRLANVPNFQYAYGDAPTAAAMLIGYYDIRSHFNFYTTYGGAAADCPLLDGSNWPDGQVFPQCQSGWHR